jgi:hypothetical protein
VAIAFVHGPALRVVISAYVVAIPFDAPCHDGNSTHLPDLTKAPEQERYISLRIR